MVCMFYASISKHLGCFLGSLSLLMWLVGAVRCCAALLPI